jgi:tRNA(Ile)-lysidine synthetase-like protein
LLKKSYQPALNETISRFMEILSAESELVNKLAESWVRANADKTLGKRPVASLDPLSSGVAANFSRRPFADLPVALQRRCVQIQLVWKGIAAGYELVEHLRLHPGVPIEVSAQRMNPAAVLPETGGDQAKSSGFRVEREAGGLVHESHSKSLVFSDECRQLDLGTGNGRLAWDGVEFAWQIFANKGLSKLKKTPGRELFDADLVGSTVILRHWLPGDRFQPIGMERAIKLQDLFVNQKVPQERRRRLTVGSTAAGDLFWVEGLRISERFKLTRATIRSLHWAWQRL